jgi:hypothetical protein
VSGTGFDRSSWSFLPVDEGDFQQRFLRLQAKKKMFLLKLIANILPCHKINPIRPDVYSTNTL